MTTSRELVEMIEAGLMDASGYRPKHPPIIAQAFQALTELRERLERVEAERDEAQQARRDADVLMQSVLLEGSDARRDKTIGALQHHITELRDRLERLEAGLQAVIDYTPEGFISPMDDEDSMNYRAIARHAPPTTSSWPTTAPLRCKAASPSGTP